MDFAASGPQRSEDTRSGVAARSAALTAETETKHSKPGEAEHPNHEPVQAGAYHRRQELIMERLLLRMPEVAARLSMSRGKVYELIRSASAFGTH